MRARVVIIVTLVAAGAAALGVSALSSAGTMAAHPARVVITQRDSGHTFKIRRTTSATLRLANRWTWTQPRVRGKAVALTRVNYESDPGFKAWEITRRAAGTAKITSHGRPNCTGCATRARSFRVTLVVSR